MDIESNDTVVKRNLFRSIHFAVDAGMFGLSGFAMSYRLAGLTIRSMSSIGIAPSKTSPPNTSAPVKHFLPSNSTCKGPT